MKAWSRAVVLALAASATLFAVPERPADGQSALEPHHLRVVWTEDPAHTATISWTTNVPGATNVVLLDTETRGGLATEYAREIAADAAGSYVEEGPWFHHARLTDLEPATAYYFVVQTDEQTSRELYFETAPERGTQFKLLYGGDSRTGTADRQMMNRRIAHLHDQDRAIVALVHGGDYIDYANTWSQWSQWLEDHELTIAPDGRVLPIVPAKGNHEGRGVVYNRVFGEPGGSASTNWFVTEIGDLTLVNLDTEVSMAGAQRDWLEAQLQAGRASKWLVVNYHRPAYPAVKSPSGAREHWVPLFERYDVDLVCESDGHALKRTPPIREDRIDYTGVTYVGEGGLGVPQRTPEYDRWYLQAPGMAASAHHVQLLSVETELLRYAAVLHEGTLLDEITILTHAARNEGRLAPAMAAARAVSRVEVSFSGPFDPQSAVQPSAWTSEPALDIDSVVAGDEVGAVLDFVNAASLADLDDTVGLDSRAAAGIVQARAEGPIESWEALDSISFVGASALERLGAHALATAQNPRNSVTLRVAGLDRDTVYRLAVTGVTDPAGVPVSAGSTVSFVYGGPDARADAINQETGYGDAEGGGCSTARTSRSGAGGGLLLLVGAFVLVGATRRRR